MPLLTIPDTGRIGLIADAPGTALPLGAFNRAENVRFKGTSVSRAGAWSSVSSGADTITARKMLRHVLPNDIEQLYAYTASGFIQMTTGNTWTDHSVVGHTPTTGQAVATSTSLALLPYFSAGDHQVLGKASTATNFVKVMDGTDHAGSSWRVVRSHKDRLFVLNQTNEPNANPQRVQWSGPVGNRELATDWDTDGLDSTSGWVDLAGFRGEILDAYPLGEHLYVYGNYGISRMWESGDEFVFNNSPVLSEDGIIATGCVVPVSEFGHFVVGRNRIYLFDGQRAHPIALNRVEEEFRNTLNMDLVHQMFVYPDYRNGEVWVCYNSSDTAKAYFNSGNFNNRALVWNYKHDTWSFRDIPNLVDMVTFGAQSADSATWLTVEGSWTGISDTWAGSGERSIEVPVGFSIGFAAPAGTTPNALIAFNSRALPDNWFNNPMSLLARGDLSLTELGMPTWSTKLVSRISFQLGYYNSVPNKIAVVLGSGRYGQGEWRFDPRIEYDPATQNWINSRLMGNEIGYRIESVDGFDMDLSGITLEIEQIAER